MRVRNAAPAGLADRCMMVGAREEGPAGLSGAERRWTMPSARDHVQRWQDAGLLDGDQARRILEFEAASARPAPADRPGVAEVLVYLGIAMVAVGLVVLVAAQWQDLEPWGRVATPGVLGVLALAAGFGTWRSPEPGLRRAAHMAWLAAVALLTVTAGVVLNESGRELEDNEGAVLAVAGFAVAVAVPLWVLSPHHPQVVAVAAAMAALAQALGIQVEVGPDAGFPFTGHGDPANLVGGVLLALFGGVGIALAEAGLGLPLLSVRLLSALGAVGGLYQARWYREDVWTDLAVLLVAGALAALGLRRATFAYLVPAVGGLFLGLVTLTFAHFEDDLGAPVALILSGAALVALALLLAAARRRLAPGSVP